MKANQRSLATISRAPVLQFLSGCRCPSGGPTGQVLSRSELWFSSSYRASQLLMPADMVLLNCTHKCSREQSRLPTSPLLQYQEKQWTNFYFLAISNDQFQDTSGEGPVTLWTGPEFLSQESLTTSANEQWHFNYCRERIMVTTITSSRKPGVPEQTVSRSWDFRRPVQKNHHKNKKKKHTRK